MFHQNLRCKVCKKVFCSAEDRRQHEFKRHQEELLKINRPFVIVRRNFSENQLPVMPDRSDLKFKSPALPSKTVLGKRKYQALHDSQTSSQIKTKGRLQRAILIPHYRLRKLKSKLKTIEEENDFNDETANGNEKEENVTIDVISPIQNITTDGIDQKIKSPEKIFTSTPITEQIEETTYETALINIPSPSSTQTTKTRKQTQVFSKKVLFSEQLEHWSEYEPPKENKSIFTSFKNSISRVLNIFSVRKIYKRFTFNETDSSPELSGLKGVRMLSHPYSRIKGRRSLYRINPPLTKYID